MLNAIKYRAPWSTSLKLMTFGIMATLLFLIALNIFPYFISDDNPHIALMLLFTIPIVLIMLILPLFIIRGYILDEEKLKIKRLFWIDTIPLDSFISAESAPYIMSGSLRIGIGGVFATSGYFQNKKLGSYEAWVTDSKRTVVITLYQRTIVISPEEPDRFVDDINSLRIKKNNSV